MNFMIKVSDFGLSERIFENKEYFRQKHNGVKLPVKWLSPESLQDGIFSEKTDVVSYYKQTVPWNVLVMTSTLGK